MNSEFNHYHINNPDGADKSRYNEDKKAYVNDGARFVKEDAVADLVETSTVSENIDDVIEENGSRPTDAQDKGGVAYSAVSKVLGGNVGAFLGTVATAAMATVLVVVAFVSVLAVEISLVFADSSRLIFKLEFSGVQEEDYNIPMFAVLESADGDFRERQLTPDTLYLAFDDLEPNNEYVIIIKNEEKVLAKKTYSTTSDIIEKGFIYA